MKIMKGKVLNSQKLRDRWIFCLINSQMQHIKVTKIFCYQKGHMDSLSSLRVTAWGYERTVKYISYLSLFVIQATYLQSHFS